MHAFSESKHLKACLKDTWNNAFHWQMGPNHRVIKTLFALSAHLWLFPFFNRFKNKKKRFDAATVRAISGSLGAISIFLKMPTQSASHLHHSLLASS
jgi:hypothetical protein